MFHFSPSFNIMLVQTKKMMNNLPIKKVCSSLTAYQINHPGNSSLYSLNSARIDFVPYQFRPALKMIHADEPRILIADSVGVGKTIEAGLIIKELQARNELENATPKYFPLKAYEQAYRYALSISKIDLDSIETLNKILTGEDKAASAHYRSGHMLDVINPLVLPPFEEIQMHFDAFFSFLSQEEIPLLIRALSIVYFFTYLRPFELFNEETAGLVAKAFLKCNHLSYFGFVLPLESLAYTTSASYFKKLKMTEETLDLTYFLQSTIRFLHYGFDLVDKDFSEFLEKGKERAITVPSSEEKSIALKDDAAIFALPDFPSMQNETEIEVLARKLMSVYPQLKKKQAHFYAGHCQVGLNYTIEQFKKEEKTVYETARTSMEDLANRGFYRKLQIGKKFVYTPIPLKEIND